MKSLHVNPPSNIRAETCGQTDWHDKRNGHISQIRERAEQACSVEHIHVCITAFSDVTCVLDQHLWLTLAALVHGESENVRTTAEASEV